MVWTLATSAGEPVPATTACPIATSAPAGSPYSSLM